ncbi:MAG: hypothetical protein ACR2QO_17220 [Acidimicrobiales bacterium]
MLRASGLATDTDVDLSLIAEGGDRADGNGDDHGAVPHADLLTRFVDAAVNAPAELPTVRTELAAATDEATMIDTAAVVAAFEMMTRIADGTGTTHPGRRLEDLSAVRDELQLDNYESVRSAN